MFVRRSAIVLVFKSVLFFVKFDRFIGVAMVPQLVQHAEVNPWFQFEPSTVSHRLYGTTAVPVPVDRFDHVGIPASARNIPLNGCFAGVSAHDDLFDQLSPIRRPSTASSIVKRGQAINRCRYVSNSFALF